MNFFKKFLSRKFLTLVGGGVANILIAFSVIPEDLKPLLMKIVTGLAGGYILVEGVIDSIKKERPLD